MSASDFKELPGVLAKIRKSIDIGVNRACSDMVKDVKDSLKKGPRFTPAPPGQPPHRQVGELTRRVGFIRSQGGRASVVSRARYSRIQEYGGTIRPVRKKWLVIPIGREAMRMSELLGEDDGVKRSVRAYDLIYVQPKGKFPYLAKIVGPKNGKNHLEPMFALRKLVRVKPHPYMRPSLKRMTPRMTEQIKGGIRRALGWVA